MPETPPDDFSSEPRWRKNLRENRVASFLILLATAAVIGLAAWWTYLLDSPGSAASGSSPAPGSQETGGKISTIDLKAAPPPKLGAAVPDFSLLNPGNQLEAQKLSDLRGQATWIVFAASWCSGCRAEMPDVVAAAAEHPQVQVLVVFLGESGEHHQNLHLGVLCGGDWAGSVVDLFA